MSVLLILIILVLLVAFALFLGGYWETPENLRDKVKNLVDVVRATKTDPPTAFRAWVDASLGDRPELRAWLLSLSDEGFKTLTKRVVAFCADLNIQLSWLVEQHLEVAPELQKAARTIVVDYLEGCCEAIRHQDEIALFRTYHRLVANPADARYSDVRRRLFTRLTSEELAEPLPSYELIMASETQRQALAAKAIRDVAAKDWSAFARILSEVLAGDAEKTEGIAVTK